MTDTSAKYAGAAERWSEEAYADSVAYLRHRAELIVALGHPLEPGDRILDLACGDAGLADFLRPYEYIGVDASEEMVRAARARGARVELADLNDYEPPEPVAATTVRAASIAVFIRPEVTRVTVETAGGETHEVSAIDWPIGGYASFTEVATEPLAFPRIVRAYAANGSLLATQETRVGPMCPPSMPTCVR